ncbi:hypothetical protein AJ87_19850 [Rhizobium yanglingense]|nr:hypothetical protein AJ87_19850 [Rhizobium yanglingense]
MISSAANVAPAWPPLAFFKVTLRWFSASEQTPERTAFVHSRKVPLWFVAWTRPCSMRSPAGSRPPRIGAGHWVKHTGVHGFLAHVGADTDTVQ